MKGNEAKAATNGHPPVQNLVLPLDLALIRWSVKCTALGELAAGAEPLLGAFLAGWYCRCIGASLPEDLGQFRDSFRAGWKEADDFIQIEINSRTTQ